MTGSFDSRECKHSMRSLGSYSSLWHHVVGTYWWLSHSTVRPGALAPCRCSRQQALGSWLPTNCHSCPSSRLPNPFSFQHMLEWSHHGEQEEEPSEVRDQLWNSDALDLFSSRKGLFHFSLLFLFSCLSFHKKDFGCCLVRYSFLRVWQVGFFLWDVQDPGEHRPTSSKIIYQQCHRLELPGVLWESKSTW